MAFAILFLLFETGFFLKNMENKYISSCHICYFPFLFNNGKVIIGRDINEASIKKCFSH